MAKIVLGLGSSHTPMLLASDETLPRFAETDQKIKHRDKEGRPATYAELLEKADPKMAAMVAPAALVARQNTVRTAMTRLSNTLNSAQLDTLIVMSDDQDEAYLEDARPTFAIYYGDTILNSNEQHEQYHQRFPEWYVKNRQAFFEDDAPRAYPVDAKLALHLIDWLMDNGFDPASSKCMRKGEGEGHGMAYVHRRLMDEINPNSDRAGFPQHLLCAEPAAAAPLLRTRPRHPPSGRDFSRRCPHRHHRVGGLKSFSGRRGFRSRHPQGLRRQGCQVLAKLAAQQIACRQFGNPQLGRRRRGLRASRP